MGGPEDRGLGTATLGSQETPTPSGRPMALGPGLASGSCSTSSCARFSKGELRTDEEHGTQPVASCAEGCGIGFGTSNSCGEMPRASTNSTQCEAAVAEAVQTICIVGSWNGWAPSPMVWNQKRRCYCSRVELGATGSETFQLWVNGASSSCLHPDRPNATAHSTIEVCGPDADGHGKNWAIGHDDMDAAVPGANYEVRLHVLPWCGRKSLDWARLGTSRSAPDRTYWLAGSWNSWVPCRMLWDPGCELFRLKITLRVEAEGSFQVLEDRDWSRCLHPAEGQEVGSLECKLQGPDDCGHGRNWRIRRGSVGNCKETNLREMLQHYMVQLHVSASDARPLRVTWFPLAVAPIDCPEKVTESEKSRPSHVGIPAGEESIRGYACSATGICRSELDSTTACCPWCSLPLGEFGYACNGMPALVHGECMARHMLQELRRRDEARHHHQAELRRAERGESGIGWQPSRIPTSKGLATQLGCDPAPAGMCCLVLCPESRSVRVEGTLEPAASVNLAYLATALQVRRRDGREPLFSLDPAWAPEGNNDAGSTCWRQVKRFEPAWLAGTILGEVLFQADYYLKELSMGESQHAVVGMRSCFEIAEEEGVWEDWCAREWFVVNEASVQLSSDGVLLPRVAMGVEAREQVVTATGLQDKELTRLDHPLVKFAEDLTKNFDLIAERRSVIFQLREVARAVLLAKFLLESEIRIDPAWETWVAQEEPVPCCMEIPQLWSERFVSRIQVHDGVIVGGEDGLQRRMQGVYGGVQLNLDHVTMPRFAGARASVSAFTSHSVRGELPRGVDMDLGAFDLSAVAEGNTLRDECVASIHARKAVPGDSFWSGWNIAEGKWTGGSGAFKKLMQAVFNPYMSDRREEGHRFVPPDDETSYLRKIHSLVSEEDEVRQRRLDYFLSESFDSENPGALFPSSWMAPMNLTNADSSGALPFRRCRGSGRSLRRHRGPGCLAEGAALLRCAGALLERRTEEGRCYRIYRVGSLEVRTTQEHGEDEVVGALLSDKGIAEATAGGCGDSSAEAALETARVAKVTEYVEGAQLPLDALQRSQLPWHYYVVLETAGPNGIVVTERLLGGRIIWQENPIGLEDRNSLAKVLRAADCTGTCERVADLKSSCSSTSQPGLDGTGGEYAQEVFARARDWQKATPPSGSKEADVPPPEGGGSSALWCCTACEEPNRPGREHCNNCGRARPEGGLKARVGRSGDLWPAGEAAPLRLWIAGTWNKYTPEEMRWDGSSYIFPVCIGPSSWESFQLLVDGSWSAAVYPSIRDATPREEWRVCGPDGQGHGKNWQIGKAGVDLVQAGTQCLIRALIGSTGSVVDVTWRQLVA